MRGPIGGERREKIMVVSLARSKNYPGIVRGSWAHKSRERKKEVQIREVRKVRQPDSMSDRVWGFIRDKSVKNRKGKNFGGGHDFIHREAPLPSEKGGGSS